MREAGAATVVRGVEVQPANNAIMSRTEAVRVRMRNSSSCPMGISRRTIGYVAGCISPAFVRRQYWVVMYTRLGISFIRKRAKCAIIVSQRSRHNAQLAQILRGAKNACSG